MMRWTEIVIHHSAGEDRGILDLESIRRWHTGDPPNGRGWLDVGYHFVAERVGESYEFLAGRPLSMVGAHALGHNRTAIGICLVGDFNLREPPEAILNVVGRHLRALVEVFGISRGSVYLHREVAATDCPGRFLTRPVLEAMLG